ncbi:MAG: flavoprotein [Victivallaceae bacterium]|nr:flavoprotein [Victivallaceae bacterium]
MSRKTIVLGVSGGIAAYKAADLCSKLAQAGYDVHVVMTEHAAKLVTPLAFMTLSRNQVSTDNFSMRDWRPEHIALADAADLAVVAPATYNIIGKLANGIADDLLSTFLAAYRKPLFVAPAMNPAMYASAALVENLVKLRERGVHIIGPKTGHVACGSDGPGRMVEPEEIFKAITEFEG